MSYPFNLCNLFPPSASTSNSDTALTSPTVALIGNLPSSSLLHLSLSHLAQQEFDSNQSYSRLSEKARGKRKMVETEEENVESSQGEDLDELDYSAVHLRRSDETRARHVLVLTPDLVALRQELASENDSSLFSRSRDAQRTALLERITFKHLPNWAQLNYFLTSFYLISNPKAAELHTSHTSNQSKVREDPSYLPFEPTMVILHSPSTYLQENVHADSGIESYAAMLALFVSTFSQSSKSPPTLVLLDRPASLLSLPIIPLNLSKSRKRPKLSDDASARNDLEDEDVDQLPLRTAIERFFEYIAEVVPVPLSPTHLEFGHLERWRIDARTRSKLKPTYAFLEFSTQRVGEDDQGEEEEGTTRIRIET